MMIPHDMSHISDMNWHVTVVSETKLIGEELERERNNELTTTSLCDDYIQSFDPLTRKYV